MSMTQNKPNSPNASRRKALDLALASIEKAHGKGAIMRLGEDHDLLGGRGVIPTGSLGLDIALGVGGIPRGRVVEVFGPESSGKTTLTLHLIAQAQKTGGLAAFIDAEHALDVTYARNLGVLTDDLLISQPDTGEQALEICETLVRSGALDIIVIDSVAALVPKAELEGNMGDSLPGLQARLMSQAMRKLTALVSKSNTIVVFINQLRMKIGVMFGSPETTTGGHALKFYCSVRIDIRRIGSIKQGTDVLGNRTRVKVVKNKVAPPFRQCEFDILFTTDLRGINLHGDILDLSVEYDVVKKLGSFYSYGDLRLGQGRMNSAAYLREHQELSDEVEAKVRAAAGLQESPPDDATGESGPAANEAEEALEAVTDSAEALVEAAQLAIDA